MHTDSADRIAMIRSFNRDMASSRSQIYESAAAIGTGNYSLIGGSPIIDPKYKASASDLSKYGTPAWNAIVKKYNTNPSSVMSPAGTSQIATFQLNMQSILGDMLTDMAGGGGSGSRGLGNGTTGNSVNDITKGAKALVINFNKEIVSMPINIDTVNDGSDLAARLNAVLPDMIVRGMNIALNNATSTV
jgi:hypothetical protein